MKYRKKPIIVEAIQYTGQNMLYITDFIGINAKKYYTGFDHIIIHTLEGDMRADIGDWIIKGIKGEFYPCKPDIFEATYEKVEEK